MMVDNDTIDTIVTINTINTIKRNDDDLFPAEKFRIRFRFRCLL